MSTTPPRRPTAEELVGHIARVGRALWAAAHLGDPAPAVALLRDRMDQPRPGDLVMEVTPFAAGDFDPDSVGRLLGAERWPGWPTRYVIEPLLRPGEQRDWLDLSLIALPDQHSYAHWADQPPPPGGQLTFPPGRPDR